VNEQMPFYVTTAVVEAIASRPVRLQEASVLVLGAAFKKNVDDTRHAPARSVVRLLREKGIEHLQYADPHVDRLRVKTDQGSFDVPRVEVTPQTLAEQDVAVLVTDHEAFPYATIREHAPMVVDARNGFEDGATAENVWLLGNGAPEPGA
jgi:UDP-N-acetyl-D-glucosamine dehydrogenase